jgi:hypothetical protein
MTDKVLAQYSILASEHILGLKVQNQGVTKICRLSWLTNIAPSNMIPTAGEGVCGASANENSCAQSHGSQINFGDLTPCLTFVQNTYIHCIIYSKALMLFTVCYLKFCFISDSGSQLILLRTSPTTTLTARGRPTSG